MTSSALAAQWRRRADSYAEEGAMLRGDLMWRRAADEMEAFEATRGIERLNQTEAAQEVGVSPATIRRWEREEKLTRIDPDRALYLRRDVAAAAMGEKPHRGLEVVDGRR